MKSLHGVSFVLLVVGGLNWLLVGALNFDLVQYIFGSWPMVAKLVYVLVGLSAVVLLASHKKTCKECAPGGQM